MTKGLAVIYDRASTQKQSENYTRMDVARIGKELANRYGYETEPEPRFEIKSGEDLKNRPVILGILTDIQNGRTATGEKITAIIVPNFTRLSRDEDIIDGLVIKKTCRENGVVVIEFNGKVYDFKDDNDQDAAFLEFWFGARDKRQMMSNLMRGAKERASQGKYMGGPAPLGYKLELSGQVNKRGKHLYKRVIAPDEAKIIRLIFKLYQKHSGTEITRYLNEKGIYLPVKIRRNSKNPDATTRPFQSEDVMRIIKNPLYAGWIRWNTGVKKYATRSKYLRDFEPQVHFDPELQIITQNEFDRAQQIRKERYVIPPRAANSKYPFSYVLKCSQCGGKMGGGAYYRDEVPKYRRHYYRCTTHFDNRRACPKGQCITAYPVASAVIPFVAKLLDDGTHLIGALKQAAKEYSKSSALEQLEAETRAELEKTNQGIARLMDAIANGLVFEEEAKPKIQELRERKDRLTRDIQGFVEKENIKEELLNAIAHINGDLEGVLWGMFEHDQKALARILRLVFKPHSIVIESFGEPSARKGRLVDYKLQEDFEQLIVDSTHPAVPS